MSRSSDFFPASSPDPASAAQPGAAAVMSVGRLVASVRLMIERHVGLIWVAGEVSGCSRAASGHWYFCLKDAEAQVRCVMFRSRAQGLPFTLRDGLAVEVRATPTLYEARGEFQLSVESVRLAGLGALYERFARLKARLEAAGWFAPDRKRALPAFPSAVGIVTSRRAAALRDVLTTLARRWPRIRVVLYPAAVQGQDAARELGAAVRIANERGEVDLLIVCRGGGSLEDLWAFNEEPLVRAVYESALPVVSGVGHETDFTICDFVADVRAPTPTGAAMLVVPDRDALAHRVGQLARRLARCAQHGYAVRAQRLDHVAQRLVHPAARLARQREALGMLAGRLNAAIERNLAADATRTSNARQRLLRELRVPLPGARAVERAAERLPVAAARSLDARRTRVATLAQNLAHLNPRAVLTRGYAIVTAAGGAIVQDSRQLSAGERVALTFAQGEADATVTVTKP